MKHAKLWYVIADGGRARFVERDETYGTRGMVGVQDGADLRHQSPSREVLTMSAIIETAISAGAFAPIDRPTGA
jgi:hypothetical protein